MTGMRQVFPDKPVEDLTDKDEIFHVRYDMDDRFQVPGEQWIRTHRTYEKDGFVPKWRGIRDDHGRIMVAICHNMHLGDAWEWADDPEYPEQFASMAWRGTRRGRWWPLPPGIVSRTVGMWSSPRACVTSGSAPLPTRM